VARSGVGLVNQWSLRQSAPFVTDVKVRQAIQSGIDREAIVKNLYTKNWSAATSLFSPGTVGYSDESAKFAYDPDKSNKLLDEAGWTERDSDGYRTKAGKRLTIKTYVDVFDNTARTLFQAIQAQLKKVGIELDIHETDYSSYDAKTADPSVAAVRTGWPGPDPAINLRNTFSPDGWDVLKIKDDAGKYKELIDLLNAPLNAASEGAEVTALKKAEDYLLDQAYSIPLLNDSQVYVAGKRVHGFDLNDGGLPEYHNAWVTD
jgi:peptide/nickel transport system substrate-binding protein